MEVTIYLNEIKTAAWCVGHFTCERQGYYAGTGSVENFKVFAGNDNVTDQLPEWQREELREKYVQYCLEEVA